MSESRVSEWVSEWVSGRVRDHRLLLISVQWGPWIINLHHLRKDVGISQILFSPMEGRDIASLWLHSNITVRYQKKSFSNSREEVRPRIKRHIKTRWQPPGGGRTWIIFEWNLVCVWRRECVSVNYFRMKSYVCLCECVYVCEIMAIVWRT